MEVIKPHEQPKEEDIKMSTKIAGLELEKTRLRTELDKLRRENSKVNLLEKKLSSTEKMLSKTEMSKSKLEQLCRELNKSSKAEKEQNQQRLKLMQQTHQETVDTFKKSLNDIQLSVEAKKQQNSKMADLKEDEPSKWTKTSISGTFFCMSSADLPKSQIPLETFALSTWKLRLQKEELRSGLRISRIATSS